MADGSGIPSGSSVSLLRRPDLVRFGQQETVECLYSRFRLCCCAGEFGKVEQREEEVFVHFDRHLLQQDGRVLEVRNTVGWSRSKRQSSARTGERYLLESFGSPSSLRMMADA